MPESHENVIGSVRLCMPQRDLNGAASGCCTAASKTPEQVDEEMGLMGD